MHSLVCESRSCGPSFEKRRRVTAVENWSADSSMNSMCEEAHPLNPRGATWMPELCRGSRRSAARGKKDNEWSNERKRNRRAWIDPLDRDGWNNYFADGRIYLAVGEQSDRAMMVGLAGIKVDQFVQRGRSRHQIDQQDQADDRRDEQPFAQLFHKLDFLIATILQYRQTPALNATFFRHHKLRASGAARDLRFNVASDGGSDAASGSPGRRRRIPNYG